VQDRPSDFFILFFFLVHSSLWNVDVLRVLEMKNLDLQGSQGSAVSEVTGSLGRRRDQGEQDLSSTFFRLPTGGNHAGSPKREMVRVRRATAGTKLAIVVMSALLLRLSCC